MRFKVTTAKGSSQKEAMLGAGRIKKRKENGERGGPEGPERETSRMGTGKRRATQHWQRHKWCQKESRPRRLPPLRLRVRGKHWQRSSVEQATVPDEGAARSRPY